VVNYVSFGKFTGTDISRDYVTSKSKLILNPISGTILGDIAVGTDGSTLSTKYSIISSIGSSSDCLSSTTSLEVESTNFGINGIETYGNSSRTSENLVISTLF
jgi:hypothetical protein